MRRKSCVSFLTFVWHCMKYITCIPYDASHTQVSTSGYIHPTFRTPYFESRQNIKTSDTIIACFYIKITVVFWVVVPCSLVESYKCFGRTCWLHLQGTRVNSFETVVTFYQTLQHHLPLDSNFHVHCHEKFKLHILYFHHRYQKINSHLCWMW